MRDDDSNGGNHQEDDQDDQDDVASTDMWELDIHVTSLCVFGHL